MKQRLVTLVDFLKREFSSYPPYYEKDSDFKVAKDALDESIATSSLLADRSIECVSVPLREQAPAYRDEILILEQALEQQVKLRDVAQKRLVILDNKRASYEKAVEGKKVFLKDISLLLNISKPSLALIAVSNKALVRQIKMLQVLVTKLKVIFTDDPGVFLKNGGTFDSMETAGINCSEEVRALGNLSKQPKKELIEFVQKIRCEIKTSSVRFNKLYDIIYKEADEARVDKTAINAKKDQFDHVVRTPQSNGEDYIEYLHNKSLELEKIVTAFEHSIPSLRAPVKDAYLKKMGLIMPEIANQIDGIHEKIDKYKVTNAEKEAWLTQLKLHLDAGRREVTSSFPLDSIVDRHQQLIASQAAIMSLIEKINRHLMIHDDVVSVLTVNTADICNFLTLADKINAPDADGSAPFLVLNHYLDQPGYVTEATFLSQLASHLGLFEPKGLNAIKLFIETKKQTPEVDALNIKLAFIDNCMAKNIDYKPYLSSPDVIAATLQLKNWGFERYISSDTCNNDSFSHAICALKDNRIKPTEEALNDLKDDVETCDKIYKQPMKDALAVLKTADITLSWDIVQKLLADPMKCEVICQQNRYRESQSDRDKILPHTFKGVLNDILDIDQPPIIAALSAVDNDALSQPNTRWPNCCMHSFVYLLKESPKIVAIFGQGKLNEDIPFLTPLIERLPQAHWLNSFWDSEGKSDGRNPGDNVRAHLALYEVVLGKLSAANLQPKASNLPSISHFMWKFNGFLDGMVKKYDQPDKQDFKNVIEQFRRQSMPILLAPKKLEEKQEDLERLARSTFKPKHHLQNILLDVLQFISLLFIVIIPVRIASNKSALFQQEKSEMCNRISDFKKELTQRNADDEAAAITPRLNK